MGAGYSVAENARTVYAEPYDDNTGDDSNGDATWQREDAWDDLQAVVTGSTTKRWEKATGEPRWMDGHPRGMIVAESGLHALLMADDEGGYGYVYISVVPHPHLDGTGMGNIAKARLDETADSIFRKIKTHYNLRVPLGYVSGEYEG